MKLNEEQKFILQDDDGNLIIVTEIEFDFNLLQSRVIPMKERMKPLTIIKSMGYA